MIDENSDDFLKIVGELHEMNRTIGTDKTLKLAAGWMLEARLNLRAMETRLQDPSDPAPLFGGEAIPC